MNKELYLYEGVTQEQLEALKDEVRDFMVLGTQDIKNNNLDIDKNGEVQLKEGAILHSTTFNDTDEDKEKLESIAINGVITKEFFGAKDEGRTHYHAEFYRANKDMSLKEFLDDERELFPKEDNSMVSILVIEGPLLAEVFKNNSFDKNSNSNDDIRHLIKGAIRYHLDELNEQTLAAIPIGVPANCFSAIVVSKDIEKDKDKLNYLHSLFRNLCILGINGKVVVEAEEVDDNE